jgi:hypothetical protein
MHLIDYEIKVDITIVQYSKRVALKSSMIFSFGLFFFCFGFFFYKSFVCCSNQQVLKLR